MVTETTTTLKSVLDMKAKYSGYWRDKPEAYWLARLIEEVGELGAATVDDHQHSPDLELTEIASIALNWLEMREETGAKEAWIDESRRKSRERSDDNFFDEEYS